MCHQRTGSLTHWLINVLNAVTGNLDVAGGAMFPNPAFDVGAVLKRARLLGFGDHGRHTQRVSGLPEMNGELPVAGLADEITTPGEGQVRGMLVFAGNPVLSTPGGGRLEEALATLEWCVAVDMYVTETTRHANVILPPVSTLERSDIDVVMPVVSVRNHIRYSPAAVPKPKDGREDWQILTALTSRLGRGVGRRAEAALASLPSAFTTPERIIDLGIALGPHGILRRGPLKGLTVAKIKRAKHGIDLGPLEPRLPGALDTADKRVQLAPPVLVEEAARLAEHAREREAALSDGYDLTLIGRRQLRSNNSWMHNSARLMKGADRCTALLHPDDAARARARRRRPGARGLARRRDRAAARGQRRDPPRRGLGAARLRARAPGRRVAPGRGEGRRERQRHHRPLGRRRDHRQRRVQRGAGQGRGGLIVSALHASPMSGSTYANVAGLPLVIERCELLPLVRDTSSGFTKVSIVVRLSGGGHVGEGEDITWDQIDQIEFLRGGNDLTWLHGTRTFDEFSMLLGWPTCSRSNRSATALASTAGGRSRARRWTWPCARTASRCMRRSAGRPGRSPSWRLSGSGTLRASRRCRSWLAVDPELRFKLDPTPGWDDDLVAELARLGCVDVIDLKGRYRNVNVAMDPEPACTAA